ncbi:DNRLRE domain-containing protein (plasmid) [Verrucomicrobiaceae bacterium 227]
MNKVSLIISRPILVLLASSTLTELNAATLFSDADTFITTHPFFEGPSTTHGLDTEIYAILAAANYHSFPLVHFDLSSLAGQTITGPVNLELYVSTGHPFGDGSSRSVSVYEVLAPWSEATTSFNNFGSTAGLQIGTDTPATAASTQTIIFPGPGPRYVTWELPATLVQQWIDDPASNNGILVRNNQTANAFDLSFQSREGENQPKLTFETIPEPSSSLLFGIGLGLAIFRRADRVR